MSFLPSGVSPAAKTTLIIALLASALLGARLWVADPFAYQLDGEDSRGYHLLAANLLNHGILSMDEEGPYDPSGRRVPGYPAFVAAVYALFGQEARAVKLVQIPLVALSCVLTFLIAQRILPSDAWSAVCALAVALHPGLLTSGNQLMSEALFTVLLLATVLVAIEWAQRGTWVAALGVGVGCGACTLVKPEAGLMVVPLAVLGLVALRGNLGAALAQAAAMVLVLAVSVAPWLVRNAQQLGEPALLVSQDDGRPSMIQIYRIRAENDLLLRPERFKFLYDDWRSAQMRYDDAMRQGVSDDTVGNAEFFLVRPDLLATFLAVRLVQLYRPASWSTAYGLPEDFAHYRNDDAWLSLTGKALLLVADGLITVLTIVAIGWLLVSRPRNAGLYVVVAALGYYVAVYGVLHSTVRYRIPTTPLCIVLVSCMAAHLAARLRRTG